MLANACECTREKVQELLGNFPTHRRETLIPILQAIQDEFGYLPEEALGLIATHLGISAAKVFGVATFYNQFRLTPSGKHTVRVCRGTACHVRGSKNLLEHFSQELGIQPGETTPDNEFTLETVACVGACSIAPVVIIDDKFFGAVQARNIGKILKPYREE
jgi:NADH-quinone oxidoreductase subunit E